jgi:hypothetical protein
MRVKVVAMDHRGFHDKLTRETTVSIAFAGHQLEGPYDLTHYVRVTNVKEFLQEPRSTALISFLMMGASVLLGMLNRNRPS